jgi:hypothetical protein
MRRSIKWTGVAAVIGLLEGSRLPAQDLARRIAASDGLVNVIYPSRPSACGDGIGSIQNLFGENRYPNLNAWNERPCVHGPARVALTVLDGEVTRLRLYVGPVPEPARDARTVTATAPEAAEWLVGLASRGPARTASEAVVALVAADTPDPWRFILRLARDDDRPRDVRRSALLWLSSGVTDHLGLWSTDSRKTDDDEMREQAVFVLSQRPKGESVPELIDLARTAKNAAARRSAIFWLGQTGDQRAADVYAELLGIR